MELETFHFLRPWWLLALIPAVLSGIWWARSHQQTSHWRDQVDPELLSVLMDSNETTTSRRGGWALATIACLACIGLAGPAWERLPQPVEQKQDALVILFDLSLSMYAGDVKPSRLVRARQKITDVLDRREEGYTALVAYAGDAHVVAPLTDDANTIANLLAALSPAMMPVLGSRLDAGMALAHELLENAAINQGRILIVTDGIDEINDATRYANQKFPVSILGVGTPSGARIPLDFANQPGRFLQDQAGDFVVPRLDNDRLRKVAELTHGAYRTVTLTNADLDAVLDAPLPQDDETIEVEREFDAWRDLGYWFAVALLPLVLLTFRRGVLAAVAIAMVAGLPAPVHAADWTTTLNGFWNDLWQRRDQQGLAALRSGEPARAATLFEADEWRGVAKYRSNSFDEASAAFSTDPGPTGQYNRGNAMAKLGAYQAAIDAYDQALTMVPDFEDAAFNKALVEKLLEQQQQQESGNENQQNQENPNESQPQQQSEDSSSGQPEDSDQQPQDGEQQPNEQDSEQDDAEQSQSEEGRNDDPEQTEAEQVAERDENMEAMEQWLRRVPDDPGGLLRRKFKFETNQRLRRGDYQNQERDKIW